MVRARAGISYASVAADVGWRTVDNGRDAVGPYVARDRLERARTQLEHLDAAALELGLACSQPELGSEQELSDLRTRLDRDYGDRRAWTALLLGGRRRTGAPSATAVGGALDVTRQHGPQVKPRVVTHLNRDRGDERCQPNRLQQLRRRGFR